MLVNVDGSWKRVARRIGARGEYWQVVSGEYYVFNVERGFVLVEHSPALYSAIFAVWQHDEVSHGQGNPVPSSDPRYGNRGPGTAAVH